LRKFNQDRSRRSSACVVLRKRGGRRRSLAEKADIGLQTPDIRQKRQTLDKMKKHCKMKILNCKRQEGRKSPLLSEEGRVRFPLLNLQFKISNGQFKMKSNLLYFQEREEGKECLSEGRACSEWFFVALPSEESKNIPLKNLQISIFAANFSHNLLFFLPCSVIFQRTKLKNDTLPVSDNRLLMNKPCIQNIPTLFPEVATTIPNIPTAIPNIPTNLLKVATILPKVATNRPMIPTSLPRIPTNRPNIPTSVGMICKRVGKAGNLVGITNHRVGTISKRVGILSKQVGMINMLVGNRGNQVVNASKEVGMAGKQVGVNNWH